MHTIQNEDDKTTQKSFSSFRYAGLVFIIALAWIFLGIAGFIMSIVCFGRKGAMSSNIIGLLMALLFGPFYWIYYIAMPREVYCGK